ncbi:MAG: hypothetical protein R6X34_28380 [Chloroflexota bacterium]
MACVRGSGRGVGWRKRIPTHPPIGEQTRRAAGLLLFRLTST